MKAGLLCRLQERMQKCFLYMLHNSEVNSFTDVMTTSFVTPKKNILGPPSGQHRPIQNTEGIVNSQKAGIWGPFCFWQK